MTNSIITITRPDEPTHTLQLQRLAWPASAHYQDERIAFSHKALYVQECAKQLYRPVIYFPKADVNMSLLTLANRHTECPLKGITDYFNVCIQHQVMEHAAWQYTTLYRYDPNLQMLHEHIAFDIQQVYVSEHTAANALNGIEFNVTEGQNNNSGKVS